MCAIGRARTILRLPFGYFPEPVRCLHRRSAPARGLALMVLEVLPPTRLFHARRNPSSQPRTGTPLHPPLPRVTLSAIPPRPSLPGDFMSRIAALTFVALLVAVPFTPAADEVPPNKQYQAFVLKQA